MEERTIKVRGGALHISEYQTTDTGGVVWEAAYVLLRYLEANGLPDGVGRPADYELQASSAVVPRPFSVLDFSGGTGMLGIATARLWPQARVVVSEYSEDALEQIRFNRDQSGIAATQCTAAMFTWGVTDSAAFLRTCFATDAPAPTGETLGAATVVASPEDAIAAAANAGAGQQDSRCGVHATGTAGAGEHGGAPAVAGGGEFDLVLCSDCLFITVRDGSECDFVAGLVGLCSARTVVLTAHKMRLWDQEELVVRVVVVCVFVCVRARLCVCVCMCVCADGGGVCWQCAGSGGDACGGRRCARRPAVLVKPPARRCTARRSVIRPRELFVARLPRMHARMKAAQRPYTRRRRTAGHKRTHAAHAHTRTHARTATRTHARTHARTHTHARTTHTPH
jgi:hypothetical protein